MSRYRNETYMYNYFATRQIRVSNKEARVSVTSEILPPNAMRPEMLFQMASTRTKIAELPRTSSNFFELTVVVIADITKLCFQLVLAYIIIRVMPT